jgi:hypothetical protein
MSNKKNQTNYLNVLICGSKNFDDSSFVEGMLDTLCCNSSVPIKTVYTSKFSGACEFARKWVDKRNEAIQTLASQYEEYKDVPLIQLKDLTFNMHLSTQNTSFYEDFDLPDFIVENDPFFQEGKKLLMENKINTIIAFPNPEGKLGASTKNIQRFSKLAYSEVQNSIFLDGSEAYNLMKHIKEEELQKTLVANNDNGLSGFKNHNKKLG